MPGPETGAVPDAAPTMDGLLVRMRAGDREAVASFIQRYGSRIRRRIRAKLGPGTRRVFDSQDILSTVARRLDQYVLHGRLTAATEPQLWSLAVRIAENAAMDRARVFKRLRSVEEEDSPFAQELLRRLAASSSGPSPLNGPDIDIERITGLLDDPVDREILMLWLGGAPHSVSAACLGISHASVRKRWQLMKAKLRASLATDPGA